MKVAGLTSILCTGLLIGACGDTGVAECTAPTTGAEAKFAANTVLLPTATTPYSFDLNGDQTPDNQLAKVITTLTQANLNVQDQVNTAVMEGSLVLLLDETAMALDTNDCAQAVIKAAVKPAMAPKYDGTDTFTVDTGIGSGTFRGTIKGGVFTSNNPATTKSPVSMTLQLPLVPGAAVPLTITAARITFTKSGDNIMKGQLNGAIKKSDVDGMLIPAVATILNGRVTPPNAPACAVPADCPDASRPCDTAKYMRCLSSADKQILDLFDTNGDHMISTDEVANNTIIKGVLKADVDLFDASGNYAPNKDNAEANRDSLSVGLGFTAVKASF